MYTITRFLGMFLILLLSTSLFAQEKKQDSIIKMNNAEKIEKLEEQKEKIKKEEREFLKQEVENINARLDKGDISAEEAEKLKSDAAKKRAQNIENRIAIIDNKIALLARNEAGYSVEVDKEGNFEISISSPDESDWGVIRVMNKNKPRKYDRRTTSDLVFGIGFNNAIIEGESLDDSPYKLGGSGFVELGYAWKTRVFNNSNFLRIKYGFSFQWNKLNIKDNQYFVRNNDQIVLEDFPLNLDKAKFRMTNLVFPVHFEFGPSKKIDRGSYVRYSTRNQLKFGIGAYGGFNLAVMQKLKYENENGNNSKDKIRSGYNTSDLIYGVSGYIALGGVAVYCKYDLNPIFKDQNIPQNNISLGLRFDMD